MPLLLIILASLIRLASLLAHAGPPVDIEKFSVIIDQQKFYQMGDLLVDDRFINSNGDQDANDPRQSGARPEQVILWEDGVLPIEFKKNVNQNLRRLVFQACSEWSQYANVRCQLGSYKKRKLKIGRSFLGVKTGCWSMLGQADYVFGIKRRMNLGPHCDNYETVLHELGHAFGLTHEHQRSDRDQYVEVLRENIKDQFMGFTYKLNFMQQSTELLTPYDFLSIMHYRQNAFTKNGQDTIRPRAGYEKYADHIGHAKHLSELDQFAIRALYGARE
ncbi:MAG: hypothetical protein KDD38_01535 [Bdellovibrionales bacterium]|nr:hypothetical protein [Bdellovibrionales bacterium]